MKQFLKQNLLIILVLMFGYTVFALATTYSRPNGTTQYVGGQKAVGPAVDSDFNSLVSWLNTGNISSVNIAAQGILGTNILNNGIGFTQLALSSFVVTSTSSAFSSTSVSPLLVTGLSTTITTSGRPVRVYLEPNPGTFLLSNTPTYYSYVRPAGQAGDAEALFFIRDGATTAHFNLTVTSTGSGQPYNQCSAFGYTETNLSAGTHTFSVNVSVSSSLNDAISVYNCRLVVWEQL